MNALTGAPSGLAQMSVFVEVVVLKFARNPRRILCARTLRSRIATHLAAIRGAMTLQALIVVGKSAIAAFALAQTTMFPRHK